MQETMTRIELSGVWVKLWEGSLSFNKEHQ